MAIQPVSIDGLTFDALIDLSETWNNDVPSYPTEKNFEVADSIIHKPLELSMTLFVTNTPVTHLERHGAAPGRVLEVVKKLKDIYWTTKPVTIVTNDETYVNMAITSIELRKALETGTSREIPISFQQINVTETKTATIPDSYMRSGATGTNAGTASTKQSTAGTGNAGRTGSSGGSGSAGSTAATGGGSGGGSGGGGSGGGGSSSSGSGSSGSASKATTLYGIGSQMGLF